MMVQVKPNCYFCPLQCFQTRDLDICKVSLICNWSAKSVSQGAQLLLWGKRISSVGYLQSSTAGNDVYLLFDGLSQTIFRSLLCLHNCLKNSFVHRWIPNFYFLESENMNVLMMMSLNFSVMILWEKIFTPKMWSCAIYITIKFLLKCCFYMLRTLRTVIGILFYFHL